jgi:hypothetical protein
MSTAAMLGNTATFGGLDYITSLLSGGKSFTDIAGEADYIKQSQENVGLYGEGVSNAFNPEVLNNLSDSSLKMDESFKSAASSGSSVGLLYDKQTGILMTQSEAMQLNNTEFKNLIPAVFNAKTGMVTFNDGLTATIGQFGKFSEILTPIIEQMNANTKSEEAYIGNVKEMANTVQSETAEQQLNTYGVAFGGKMDQNEYTPSFVRTPQSVEDMNLAISNVQAPVNQATTPQQMSITIQVTGSDKNEIASEVQRRIETELPVLLKQYRA